jgi:hypothetical protein
MKAMRTLGTLVSIVAMASPALGSVRHVHCDVPGETITKALKARSTGRHDSRPGHMRRNGDHYHRPGDARRG